MGTKALTKERSFDGKGSSKNLELLVELVDNSLCMELNQSKHLNVTYVDIPGRPFKVNQKKMKQAKAKGHKTRTIHVGGEELGIAPFNWLPQYHNAVIQICCEP